MKIVLLLTALSADIHRVMCMLSTLYQLHAGNSKEMNKWIILRAQLMTSEVLLQKIISTNKRKWNLLSSFSDSMTFTHIELFLLFMMSWFAWDSFSFFAWQSIFPHNVSPAETMIQRVIRTLEIWLNCWQKYTEWMNFWQKVNFTNISCFALTTMAITK